MKKFFVSLLVFVSFFSLAIGQDSIQIKAPSIAFKVGVFNFKKTPITDNATESVGQFGIQYFKGYTPHLDLMLNLDFTSLKYPFYTSSKIGIAKTNEMYTALDASLNYKLGTDLNKIVPYLSAGIGVASIKNSYYTAYAPVGVGLQIKARQGSFINILSTYRAEVSSFTKTHYNHSISYSFPLKLRDKKPVMIPPAPVVSDDDNDGVVGSDDECPNIKGVAKYKGCTIPDSDNDGVNDEMDKCPTVKGLSRYQGCPIPDSDKDGINDEEDKCPTTPGIASNFGCADVQPQLNEISNHLKFESGKVKLSKKGIQALDSLVAILVSTPHIHIDVNGHTDNTGTLKINTRLSMQRAMVVVNYLVKKGVDKQRLNGKGFAATMPIADNKTSKGRAQNRRVNIIINN